MTTSVMIPARIIGMRSARLLSMLLLLQTHERMTSRELAARLEVSARTILRDVEALSAAGVPVHTEQGRYGAIVLDHRARLDPARLDPAELQLLTVAGLDTTQWQQVGLRDISAKAREKLTATVSRRRSSAGRPLSEVLLVDPQGWFSPSHDEDLSALLQAAQDPRRVRLRYRRSGERTSRSVVADPYGLVSKAASWYLVADVDGRPRIFHTGRIESWEALPEAAVLREGETLRSVWRATLNDFRPTTSVEIHAHLRASRLDLARRILGTRLSNSDTLDGEWVAITVRYPEVEGVRQLLQFGDHIRILAPPAAVERVRALATALLAVHTPPDGGPTPCEGSA